MSHPVAEGCVAGDGQGASAERQREGPRGSCERDISDRDTTFLILDD